MTHLTPEEREQIREDLKGTVTYSYRWPTHRECMQMLMDNADAIEQRAGLAESSRHANALLGLVDDALAQAGVPKEDSDGNEYGFAERIAKLAKDDDDWAAKCDALAGQVVVLREALEAICKGAIANISELIESDHAADLCIYCGQMNGCANECPHEIATAALALSLPQVAEWKEKAELLDWLMQYSESRFSQWIARYKAGNMMGHMTLIEALRAAREASDE